MINNAFLRKTKRAIHCALERISPLHHIMDRLDELCKKKNSDWYFCCHSVVIQTLVNYSVEWRQYVRSVFNVTCEIGVDS